MRAFAALFAVLDRTTSTTEKLAALEGYLRTTPPADAAWALWFLAGRRPRRAVPVGRLREWVAEAAGLPVWLVEECHETVGDLAETLALLLPPAAAPDPPALGRLIEDSLLPLAEATEARQRELLRAAWARLDTPQRFLWHKLMTGNFRMGISRPLLLRALAGVASVAPAVMAYRLMGDWRPTAEDYRRLLTGEGLGDDPARPYPFHLASPLEDEVTTLGDVGEWFCEWKWDGIRAQLIRRSGRAVLWSRGEEIVTATFPEIAAAAMGLPEGTVLDGELLAWRDHAPLPFALLQRRLNRRGADAALRRDIPVVFLAYDLLEEGGTDGRERPLADRRRTLEALIVRAQGAGAGTPHGTPMGVPTLVQGELFDGPPPPPPPPPALQVSPLLAVLSWSDVAAARGQARATGAEGVMLKARTSAYGVGRQRGAWWKWKLAPYTCEAVLVAAQPGHGRRAGLFTDYTFAVWQGTELVSIAKAYSGLTDEEIRAVDAFIRQHVTGRFGPVRSVEPLLVFELAFEGLAASNRHKAGLALRFPRILRWRHDKVPGEADTLETLQRLAAGSTARNAG